MRRIHCRELSLIHRIPRDSSRALPRRADGSARPHFCTRRLWSCTKHGDLAKYTLDAHARTIGSIDEARNLFVLPQGKGALLYRYQLPVG